MNKTTKERRGRPRRRWKEDFEAGTSVKIEWLKSDGRSDHEIINQVGRITGRLSRRGY
jgi:hypothetical protein